jgi:glycosyltransferase involved in cell wall biosynthesis
MMSINRSASISVLMPVYQPNPEWLRACIHSLNAQTYQHWQLVLSLDGDDPLTRVAVKIVSDNLAAGHALVVVEGPHSGITGALNRGLEACHTPYTARLDADDLCRPIRLEQQWRLLEEEPKLVACGMQIQGIDAMSLTLQKRLHHYPTTPNSTLLVGAIFNTPIAHPVLMFRTDLAKSMGGYRPQPCMEDYDLMARLSRYGNLTNLNEVGLDYRIHAAQHSQKVRPKRSQLLAARYRFLGQLTRQQPFSLALLGWPLFLYAIGPRGEYRLRRLVSRWAAKFKY